MKVQEQAKFTGRLAVEVAVFVVLTYVAHWSGQVMQIGGAQLAPSIPVYSLMALVLAKRLTWPTLGALPS